MNLMLPALVLSLSVSAAPAKIDGWHGLRIQRERDCGQCCKLLLPKTFGSTDQDELALLRRLVDPEARREIATATECGSMALRQGIMEHLLRLATELQSRGAAEIILRADAPGGVDLGGGEWSETHGELFIVPLLMDFTAVRSLVDKDLEEHVANKVCGAVAFRVGPKEIDLPALLRRLEERAASPLADLIRRRCSALSEGLERR